jgi:hypothetical protein
MTDIRSSVKRSLVVKLPFPFLLFLLDVNMNMKHSFKGWDVGVGNFQEVLLYRVYRFTVYPPYFEVRGVSLAPLTF